MDNGPKIKPLRSSAPARWLLRLTLAGLLAAALGYLPYHVYGPEGLVRAERLEQELGRIQQGNRELVQENRELRRQIERLKHDPAAVEQVARDDLGLVRPNEVIYLFE